MRIPVDCASLLAFWERAVAVPAAGRGDALLAAAGHGECAGLGARNQRLIDLDRELFGGALELVSHCPSCGTAAQFNGNLAALVGRPEVAAESHRLDRDGLSIEFRLPDAGDVEVASRGDPDPETFALRLLERCVHSCRRGDGDTVALDALPMDLLDAVSQRMEALDPAASIAFDIGCPACDARWTAPLDVPQMVWRRLQSAAETLFLEIDALARAYGWSERDILGLTPLRRAAYLQMAAA